MQRNAEIHLVRVMPDNGPPEIWLAATPQADAVNTVLDAVPEGWTASLVQRRLSSEHAAALKMKPGEVRKHQIY